MIHELKIWPKYFDLVYRKNKTFELRKDDRGFKLGDILKLREFDPSTRAYLGRWILAEVIYLLRDFPGLEDGYCLMSICPYADGKD